MHPVGLRVVRPPRARSSSPWASSSSIVAASSSISSSREVGRQRVRGELGAVEDLVRPGPPDARRARAGRGGTDAAGATLARAISASSAVPMPTASGPRCASSASRSSGRKTPTFARFFGPPSVRIELAAVLEPQPERRRLRAFRPGSRKRTRPALIRWMWRTSSPSSVGKSRCLPRRRAPSKRRPSSAASGGSNVFSVAMCAGPALSDRRAGQRLVERPASRLHLGKLGHDILLVDAISVAVTRGGVVESRHRAHAVSCATSTCRSRGETRGLVAFVRSSAKPLQALPLVPYDLPPEELAIACASHEARPDQLVAVRALLERAGATADDLECGAEHGSRLRHNCSGKHAGFLFLSRTRGWETEGYRLPEHPLQQELLALVAETVGRARGRHRHRRRRLRRPDLRALPRRDGAPLRRPRAGGPPGPGRSSPR